MTIFDCRFNVNAVASSPLRKTAYREKGDPATITIESNATSLLTSTWTIGITDGDYCPGEWTGVATWFINGTTFEATETFFQSFGATRPVAATWTNLRTADLTPGTIPRVSSIQILN